MKQQQEVEQKKGECNTGDEDEGPQQDFSVTAAVTAERVHNNHLSGKDNGRPRSSEQQHSLPSRHLSPGPSQDGAGGDVYSDDELNVIDLDEDDKEPRPTKRKRPSLTCDGPLPKKRKHRLRQPISRRRPPSKPYRHVPNSHSPPDQDLRNAKGFSREDRLTSPTPSAPQTVDIGTPPNCSNPGGSSTNILPKLAEITFRPYSHHYYSFIAVIREGHKGRGVSFSQVAQLIESVGHGKIEDFTIRPSQQDLFLLTGLSQHSPSQRLSSGSNLTCARWARMESYRCGAYRTPTCWSCANWSYCIAVE